MQNKTFIQQNILQITKEDNNFHSTNILQNNTNKIISFNKMYSRTLQTKQMTSKTSDNNFISVSGKQRFKASLSYLEKF